MGNKTTSAPGLQNLEAARKPGARTEHTDDEVPEAGYTRFTQEVRFTMAMQNHVLCIERGWNIMRGTMGQNQEIKG